MHRLSCSAACGIFPDQGLNPCFPHWQVDSLPLSHQGSPSSDFYDSVRLQKTRNSGRGQVKITGQVIADLRLACVLNSRSLPYTFHPTGKAIFFRDGPRQWAHQCFQQVEGLWSCGHCPWTWQRRTREDPGAPQAPTTPELCPGGPQTRWGLLEPKHVSSKTHSALSSDCWYTSCLGLPCFQTPLDTTLAWKGSPPKANDRLIKHKGKVWKLIEIFNRQCKP